MKKIVFVAGDKSGDLYAGLLSKELKELYGKNIEIFSFGGSVLAEWTTQITNLVNLSVSGIFEPIKNLREILRIFKIAIKEIKEKIKPDLVILVDFPEFNLKLAKHLKPEFKIFYYISPQIWAWRKKRIRLIKKYIDKMIVIFNFEKKIYQEHNIPVFYFGHPLLDIIKYTHTPQPCKLILFLPGSRKNEITHHLPLMLKTKEILERELPQYKFIIVRPQNIEEKFYHNLGIRNTSVAIHSYELLSKAKFILTASGTATLELAILGTPFAIVYKMDPATWLILKKIVKTKWIGMPNIVAGEKIVEEFIQRKASPQNLAWYTLETIANPSSYLALKEKLKGIYKKLLPLGAIKNTAQFIGEHLKDQPG